MFAVRVDIEGRVCEDGGGGGAGGDWGPILAASQGCRAR